MSKAGEGKIGFWAVVAIGVGGMVGGGIFAVLGLAVQLAHGGTPVAFVLAGGVALLTAYSYAKLSVAYPSRGGTVTFLDRAFGAGMFTGSLNILLWLSYVVMLSLYALAFGSYGATFLPKVTCPPQIGPRCVNAFQNDSGRGGWFDGERPNGLQTRRKQLSKSHSLPVFKK